MVKKITDLSDDISAAQISYWKKDEMRNALKALKKKIDDKDRERKAAVLTEVVDLSKSILTQNPNMPFFVYEFNGKSELNLQDTMVTITFFGDFKQLRQILKIQKSYFIKVTLTLFINIVIKYAPHETNYLIKPPK